MKKYFYPLIDNPFRTKDVNQAIKVLRSSKITSGPKTLEFQNEFSKKIKTNYSLLVNSGSSANLLAIQCLINPYRKKRLKQGDEILIPSLCWSTSLWPIIQSGLKPKFVHVLGNCTNMDVLMNIIKKYNLILIEDTCESLGTTYKNKYLGTFGEFSSFSFYSSHQISSGEGGMVCCKYEEDFEIIKSLRSHGWSRGLKNEKKIAKNNKQLDKRFIFYNSGFNLRSTDISASIGLSQFKDLDKFIKVRRANRNLIIKTFEKYKINKFFNIIEENRYVKPSWFGIPILISKKLKKEKIINNLEKKGVETRPIISGNFLKQPSIKKYNLNRKMKMKNAEYINQKGFFIGLPTKPLGKNKVRKLAKIFEQSI